MKSPKKSYVGMGLHVIVLLAIVSALYWCFLAWYHPYIPLFYAMICIHAVL